MEGAGYVDLAVPECAKRWPVIVCASGRTSGYICFRTISQDPARMVVDKEGEIGDNTHRRVRTRSLAWILHALI